MTDKEIQKQNGLAMIADAEGKEVQRYNILEEKGWVDAGQPTWFFDRYDYRPKPEPREIWVIEGVQSCRSIFDSKKEADRWNEKYNVGEITHYREVI